MTILIAYASKHGATREIAERIAEKLRQTGKETETRAVDAVEHLESYEAVVIGSAIYYGSWLKAATEWVHQNQTILAARPVWLFSSGPLGTEVKDTEPQPKEIAEFQKTIAPRGQQIFFGAIDHDHLSFAERMMVKAVRSPAGDFRDWEAIDAWAASIASDLVVGSKGALV
ncbi:MAG: flavodoxin domain-containing protein [Ktedonobacteraceae bacterium]|nr:flavodoxin domain-containing protein [Ktedonobacteraceae bacterium]